MSRHTPLEVAGRAFHGAVAGATALAAEVTEYATRGAVARNEDRPNLKLVSSLRPVKASRGTFSIVVGVLLVIGLGTMLIINTQLAQGSFAMSSLKSQLNTLSEQEAVLSEQVSNAAAPESLANKAHDLGMVASQNPVFLSVPDGTVLGRPRAAVGDGVPIDMKANATSSEAVDNGALGERAVPGPNYDPATTDGAASKANGAKRGEDSLWQEVPIQVGNVGSGDAGLVAVPVR
ncbi:MAG: hypothetical protein F2923_05700 [Actinobacteria bacterium]|uniref:Unannotated protein n=1 Tax=freshwater metagenome TaxID=449393 RepID=A0A6J7FEM0_9ZZZZ|nr:hypothetical protein [Actinomycetota bacterium]MTB28118.1 hypothetical protein [Actinomycetota bacterium]